MTLDAAALARLRELVRSTSPWTTDDLLIVNDALPTLLAAAEERASILRDYQIEGDQTVTDVIARLLATCVRQSRKLREGAEERDRLKEAFKKFAHHIRGCKIRPDSPIMRALAPKGETFVPVPCSCGFDEARAALGGPSHGE